MAGCILVYTSLLNTRVYTWTKGSIFTLGVARHPNVWTGNGYWGDIALMGNVSRGNMSPVYCGLRHSPALHKKFS